MSDIPWCYFIHICSNTLLSTLKVYVYIYIFSALVIDVENVHSRDPPPILTSLSSPLTLKHSDYS